MFRIYSPDEARGYLEAFEQMYASMVARSWYGDHICMAAQPRSVHGSPDDLVDEGVDRAASVTGGWAKRLVESVSDRASEAQVLEALAREAERIDQEELAEIIFDRMLRSLELGALDSQWERENGRDVGLAKFRVEQPYARMPRQNAYELWQQREVIPHDQYEALAEQLRGRAFSFAGAAKEEMLNVAHAELGRGLRDGALDLQGFKKNLEQRLESSGWTPNNKSHVETIIRTNIASTMAAGRLADQTQPAVLKALPYWQIQTVRDARARPSHKNAHGIVLPADHPFWLKAYPPFGYNCRCRVNSRTRRWVERQNATIGPVPADLPDPGFASGKTAMVQVPAAYGSTTGPSVPAASPRSSSPREEYPRFPQEPVSVAPQPKSRGRSISQPIERAAPPPFRPPVQRTNQLPKKPETRTEIRSRYGAVLRLNLKQRTADQHARWLRASPEARRQASTDDRAKWMQWEWVSGSNRRNAVVMKHAAATEFKLEAPVWANNKRYRIAKTEVQEARRAVRSMRDETQEWFKKNNVRTVTLYRGVKNYGGMQRSAVESWTSDPKIAEKFAGPQGIVLKQEIRVSDILTHWQMPSWVDGPFGKQKEYLVMR